MLAQIVYVIGLVCNTVGIPQIVTVSVAKLRPPGKVALIYDDVIFPLPTKVALRGNSRLAVLLVRVRFSGEYDRVGNSSTMVMLM